MVEEFIFINLVYTLPRWYVLWKCLLAVQYFVIYWRSIQQPFAAVFKNFAGTTGKHLRWILFLINFNFIKKRLQYTFLHTCKKYKINFLWKKWAPNQWFCSCEKRINVSSKERVKLWFFVTFNIILKHIFPENFTEWKFHFHLLKSFRSYEEILCQY